MQRRGHPGPAKKRNAQGLFPSPRCWGATSIPGLSPCQRRLPAVLLVTAEGAAFWRCPPPWQAPCKEKSPGVGAHPPPSPTTFGAPWLDGVMLRAAGAGGARQLPGVPACQGLVCESCHGTVDTGAGNCPKCLPAFGCTSGCGGGEPGEMGGRQEAGSKLPCRTKAAASASSSRCLCLRINSLQAVSLALPRGWRLLERNRAREQQAWLERCPPGLCRRWHAAPARSARPGLPPSLAWQPSHGLATHPSGWARLPGTLLGAGGVPVDCDTRQGTEVVSPAEVTRVHVPCRKGGVVHACVSAHAGIHPSLLRDAVHTCLCSHTHTHTPPS